MLEVLKVKDINVDSEYIEFSVYRPTVEDDLPLLRFLKSYGSPLISFLLNVIENSGMYSQDGDSGIKKNTLGTKEIAYIKNIITNSTLISQEDKNVINENFDIVFNSDNYNANNYTNAEIMQMLVDRYPYLNPYNDDGKSLKYDDPNDCRCTELFDEILENMETRIMSDGDIPDFTRAYQLSFIKGEQFRSLILKQVQLCGDHVRLSDSKKPMSGQVMRKIISKYLVWYLQGLIQQINLNIFDFEPFLTPEKKS